MKKILVGLFVPAIQERFDLFVPGSLPIKELIILLAGAVAELSSDKYVRSGTEMLVRKDPNMLLDPELTLADYGIQDGAQLILM